MVRALAQGAHQVTKTRTRRSESVLLRGEVCLYPIVPMQAFWAAKASSQKLVGLRVRCVGVGLVDILYEMILV